MGGDAATVAAMTEKARQLGALDTRPATPSGLDGPGMATSAYDLAVLFRQAMGEPLFAETIATREIPFPGYGDRPGFVLSNANPLLSRYPGTLGSKTGFTDAARHTIVARRRAQRAATGGVAGAGREHPDRELAPGRRAARLGVRAAGGRPERWGRWSTPRRHR